MDAGVVDSFDGDVYPSKLEAPAPPSKGQESHDDGYETSNSGETAQKKPTSESPDPPPLDPAVQPSEGPDIEPEKPTEDPPTTEKVTETKTDPESPTKMTEEKISDMDKTEDEPEKNSEPTELSRDNSDVKDEVCDKGDSADVVDNKIPDMEIDADTRPGSLPDSPKRPGEIIPEDSRSNLSPEASNSQSESSVATLQSNNQSFDNPENLNMRHDESSSQDNPYPPQMPAHHQENPYNMAKDMMSQFVPGRGQDHFNFGNIKREPYEMNPVEHDPYAQYKREDQYMRENDPYARYKRPEPDMYGPNSYTGFGMKREMGDPYAKCNPYPNQQMFPGLKRDTENEMMMYNGIKRESEDPYSFVDDEAAMCAMLGQQQGQNLSMVPGMGHGPVQPDPMMMLGGPNQQAIMSAPKKRGRKKKLKDENGMEIKQEPGMEMMTPIPKPVKERKKHDRFNGMSEEEVSRRTLPDHLSENLDIVIIGINPGLFAAYKGHHYAGPGNHFWKCLYLSGLTREQMSADEDYKLLHFGIGFTNMVQRATKGSADLTRREIKEGSAALLEKIQTFRPKIAVFNGKLIYEVFSGKKDFCFGKQSDTVHGTNTYMWVMPSSSARCAQLPRAADKVPFYAALKKFRDYLNGTVHHVDESELIFPDTTCRRPQEEIEARRLTMGPDTPCETMILEDGTEVPIKKKRGRPKKIKLENGEVAPPTPRAPRAPRATQPPVDCLNGEQPAKKKRGRPKKIRPDEQQFLLQQQQQQQQQTLLAQNPLPSMQTMNQSQAIEGSYGPMHQPPEFQNPSIQDQGRGAMMFPSNQNVIPNQQSGTGPATSPYFHNDMNQSSSVIPEQQNPSDLSLPSVSIGPPGTPGALNNMPRSQPTYGQSPVSYSQSPRPQNLGYNQSPRSQGYSQSPQRHQTITPSYSNSPVPPTQNIQQPTPSPYPQSPANPNSQTPQYRQTSPQRPHSQNYSSPASAHPYSRSPVPQSYSQPQQSPMYAQSPANPGGQRYTETSPVPQNMGGYSSHSPVPSHPYSHSPVPQNLSVPPYSQSPAPQNLQNPAYSPAPAQPISYSQRSPAPQNNQPYSQSPVPQGSQPQSYQSPSRSSYSQHSSPAHSQRSQSYSNSPVSQTATSVPLHPAFASQNRIGTPQSYSQNKPSPPDAQNSNSNNNSIGPGSVTPQQQFANDLSTEISAAISSPGPVSPGMGHIDFEPPIATSKIRVPETDSNSMTNPASQDNSPMQPGSNSNSSVADFKQSAVGIGQESQYSSREELHGGRDLMGNCDNPLLQMHDSPHLPSPVQGQNLNRHSALNLIGPPTSSASSMSQITPSMDPLQNSLNLRGTPTPYSNSLYGQSSPLHEQRLGFQVPQPTNSANSSYGTDLTGGLTSNSPKLQLDSGLGMPGHHDRLGPNPYGYQPDQNVRLQEHQLHQHASAMYASQFNRSTPPHHPLGHSSPFSPQSGNGGGAFRGISQQSSQSLDNNGSNQTSTGMPHTPGGSPLDYNTSSKPPTTTGQKSQDVASKSLSGLESLVDQIPSIADGSNPENLAPPPPAHPTHPANPTPVTPLADPYAAHPASLYNPYNPYQATAYGPSPVPNNSYPSPLAASSFVGYPGNPYGQLMRPTPGYLPDALSPYHHPHHHSGYPGLPSQQYGAPAGPAYPSPAPPPNYSAYYNGYGAAGAIQNPANMPTYLSSHVLDHIHKNAAADSSVSFGSFC